VNPAMSRCPGQPASGHSRFGVPAALAGFRFRPAVRVSPALISLQCQPMVGRHPHC
jgi:hypothetical protein